MRNLRRATSVLSVVLALGVFQSSFPLSALAPAPAAAAPEPMVAVVIPPVPDPPAIETPFGKPVVTPPIIKDEPSRSFFGKTEKLANAVRKTQFGLRAQAWRDPADKTLRDFDSTVRPIPPEKALPGFSHSVEAGSFKAQFAQADRVRGGNAAVQLWNGSAGLAFRVLGAAPASADASAKQWHTAVDGRALT